ncbi:MAG: signal peptidase II [Candidatus Omnitrophica bacterium]|nr:signal peptidase II [Candidatus Omnitrophota bacterium]
MRLFFASLVVVILDQLTKLAVELFLRESVPVIPNIFYLTRVHNSGGAFGLFTGFTWMFVAVGLLTLAFGLLFRRSIQTAPRLIRWAAVLILGGALGNLIDRLRFGYVIDFLDFRVWPVFNLADSSITVGTCLIVWSIFAERGKRNQIPVTSNQKITDTRNQKVKNRLFIIFSLPMALSLLSGFWSLVSGYFSNASRII